MPRFLPPPLDLGRASLSFDGPPLIMGILNTTPDSFSDGGLHLDPSRALQRALQMIDEGAAILDVGGESTRPGAQPIDAQEELDRVLPLIRAIRARSPVPISIDTTKAAVADAALQAGADLINDISGLTADPDMIEVALQHKAPVVLMHLRGNPQTMMQNTHYDDVVAEVEAHLLDLIDHAQRRGLQKDKIIIDAGVGFGKDLEGNLRLIRHSDRLARNTGCALLVGPSRKRFIGALTGVALAHERDPGTAGAVAAAACYGAHLLRVHNVSLAAQAARVAAAIRDAP
jgi:dihydropteroate synthase